ncbi:hypothetical protein OAQ99_05390 [Candidatus Kapabacteria bacterium]|nr:hypothetical protein [Candidatus Kapabacteria bacterium]
MQLSKDTTDFIDVIDSYSEGKLRKKNDLGTCFEICASYSGEQELQTLVFQSKILWNLSKKLRSTTKVDKGIELIQKEFESSLTQIRDILNQIADKLADDDKERFNDIYLGMTKGNVLNIIDLSHDFGIFKDMQAEIQKHKA